MNLQQFAALKIGDKIEHPMTGSVGEVVELRDGGVVVCWDCNQIPHFFSVRSTAWMSWDKKED